MKILTMIRRPKKLTLDESIIDGVESLVEKTPGINSFSAYIERVMAAHLIDRNLLPANYVVPGEMRGGDRYAGRKKKTQQQSEGEAQLDG